MWYSAVVWTQFAMGTFQPFIYYKNIWFSDKYLKNTDS